MREGTFPGTTSQPCSDRSVGGSPVNAKQNQRGAVLWQRNYYDHIIRNDRALNNIRWYIANNPFNWQLDRDNERNLRKLSPPETVEEYVKDVEEMVLNSKADHS